MSLVRAIDTEHNWLFGKGRNDYRKDLLAVSQNIETRLLSFLGDCFFATNVGIDWFNLLGGKDVLRLNIAVSTTILNTEGVTGKKQISVSLDHETRNIQIQYQVQTVYGPLEDTFQYDVGAI